MTITWNTDVNAPCCPGEIVAADGRSLLIDRDWDYPGVASTFGWSLRCVQRTPEYCCDGESPCDDPECEECAIGRSLADKLAATGPCDHDRTDGTVPCPECGLTASDFVAAAYDWLREHNGAVAEDPGYF